MKKLTAKHLDLIARIKHLFSSDFLVYDLAPFVILGSTRRNALTISDDFFANDNMFRTLELYGMQNGKYTMQKNGYRRTVLLLSKGK